MAYVIITHAEIRLIMVDTIIMIIVITNMIIAIAAVNITIIVVVMESVVITTMISTTYDVIQLLTTGITIVPTITTKITIPTGIENESMFRVLGTIIGINESGCTMSFPIIQCLGIWDSRLRTLCFGGQGNIGPACRQAGI